MAKQTNLELVKDILSSIDGDEINSVSDNVESMQVLRIVRRCFEQLKDGADLPEHFGLVNLTPSLDADQPVLMALPDRVSQLLSVHYNKMVAGETADNFQPVTYVPLNEFRDMMYQLSTDDDDVGSMEYTDGDDTNTFYFRTDTAPNYYTTFDDHTLIFDSYDSDVDATLQSDKTSCYCKFVIPFEMTDAYIPDLDESQFILLKQEATALAWAELKQTAHQRAERDARNQKIRLQRTQDRVKKVSFFDTLPDYGRK